MADADRNSWLLRTVEFLRNIGLTVHVVPEQVEGFIPGVLIADGEIIVSATAPPSNLLHEAGHLAIIPEDLRHLAGLDVEASIWEAVQASMEQITDPDDASCAALVNISDQEATAWAFAAGRAIGLPDDLIILDDEYEGVGGDVRFALKLNAHPGIHGLRAAGMCASVRTYPTLLRWTQPGSAESLKAGPSPH